MKPRTSRTGTLSAVSGLRAATPALLFLLGVLLAALWLLAAPAQAESLPEVLQKPDRGHALERVEEVTAPVTDTLGIVHQRVEQGAAEVTSTATALPEPTVTEVHDEVRGVVTELDRDREEVTEHEPATAPVTTEATGPATEPVAPDEPSSQEGARSEGVGVAEPASATPLQRPHRVDRADVVEPTESVDTGSTTEPATDRPGIQAAASSSTTTTSAPAPATAVAGYLDSAVLPGPDGAAAPARAQRPHGTPADPADDPTVSPD